MLCFQLIQIFIRWLKQLSWIEPRSLLDTLYDNLMKKARKLMLHKTKVAVGAKTILHAVTMIEPNPPKDVEMKMGYANNLFALSIKWKTGKDSVLDWSKDIPVWKNMLFNFR